MSANEDADLRAAATEAADEIIGAFERLYPRLALPHAVWGVLHEMIEREFMGRLASRGISAMDLLDCEDTIKAAGRSGLR